MATLDESTSLNLCFAASKLYEKGHFARAADKFGAAAAAAAQELVAEDCLVVANLRSWQVSCLNFHSAVPTLAVAERDNVFQTVCELIVPCMATLTRRKEASTLLPGSCRPTEVAWFRANKVRHYGDIMRADEARAYADAFAPAGGPETYFLAAAASLNMIACAQGDLQRLHAAFLASALDLLASQPREPVFIRGELARTHDLNLAANARRCFQNEYFTSRLCASSATLLINAWRRVERSGVLEQRFMGRAAEPFDPSESIQSQFEAAEKEGAARGLHTCALAGCAAKEVHVSQFKKCGACMKIAYCCREHQVEAWPAHKAACKAARKAAAAKDDS